jgi:hypothetical protein
MPQAVTMKLLEIKSPVSDGSKRKTTTTKIPLKGGRNVLQVAAFSRYRTRSVHEGIPTQSVGTRTPTTSRSHALRGNACIDAPRRVNPSLNLLNQLLQQCSLRAFILTYSHQPPSLWKEQIL